jgi:TonB-linked SusC/RagA family outer membrane protein
MKRKINFLLFLFSLSMGITFAQTRVTGKVVDENGEPVIGASILVKGTTIGTVTDIDGNFTLTVPAEGKTLVISYVGMKTQEVPVSPNVRVVMQTATELLEEVVVVGYGTQRKENLTGAVSSVDVSKTLDSRPIPDVGRGLQGTTPGLSVIIPSGEVGSDPLIKIRGQIASFEGGSKPLILLDNVEIPSIQVVNPNDIESISILKDAASASIYGSKGAFGVVLITTKKGAKQERIDIRYSTNVAWQNISKRMEMGRLDAMEYSILAAQRVGSTLTGAFWQITPESFKKSQTWHQTYGSMGPDEPMVYGRDWYVDENNRKLGLRTYDPYDYMIREWTPSNNHDLSVNGKSGKTSYNIGIGYLHQNGMMKPAKKDDFTRYNGTIRLNTELNEYITLRAGAIYSDRNKRYPYATSSTTADPWLYMYRWGPIQPYGYENGNVIRSPHSETMQANTANIQDKYYNVNIGGLVNITKDWMLDFDFTNANLTYINNRPGTRYTALNSWGGAIPLTDALGNRIYVNDKGEQVSSSTPNALPAYQLALVEYTAHGANPDHIYRNVQNAVTNTLNIYTTYNLRLKDMHAFKFMVGMNRVTYDAKNNWSQITDLADIVDPQFGKAVGTQTSGGKTEWDAQLGYFGRINYALMNKYLFEANLRYDGSSKFPKKLWWRWFPSFSAGWIVTEEPWMQWVIPVVSSMKIRGSWGVIGDQTVPNNLYVPTMSIKQINWLDPGGKKIVAVGTPAAVSRDITWQDLESMNFGVDFRFFDSSLGFTFDWYRRDTKNMIVPGEGVALTFGANAPKGNYGSMRTDGWEIALDYNHRFENGIGINVMGTLSDAVTTVLKYGDTQSIDGWYKGKKYGEIWGYRTDRLYQKEDFVLDADGNPQKITLTENESKKYAGKVAYKLSDAKGKPVYQVFLQNSSNFFFGPGDVKFVDLNVDGELDDGSRLLDDHGDLEIIGNSTPRYEYGLRLGADYKGVDLSVFLQGVGSRKIWGDGFLVIPGYHSSDGAMPQAIAEDFWRPDRTDAFYPAPYNLNGTNKANNIQVQSRYLLNMAYLRVKNITLGYSLPQQVLNHIMLKQARIYLSLENFFTFDKLRGLPIDPEVISGYSMFNETNYNLGRTGVSAPTFKSGSIGLQITF